jgi:hypothetical protein
VIALGLTARERNEAAARDVLLEAARLYADATSGDGRPGEDPAKKASMLRLAAKAWRMAERALAEEQRRTA